MNGFSLHAAVRCAADERKSLEQPCRYITRAMVVPPDPAEHAEASELAACKLNCAHRRPARMSWARLLKRVFEIDLEHCPNCGGELKIIAAILEAPVIERILTLLGLQARRRRGRRGAERRCCKRPDRASSFAFRRFGARGRGGRLRLALRRRRSGSWRGGGGTVSQGSLSMVSESEASLRSGSDCRNDLRAVQRLSQVLERAWRRAR